MTSAQTLDLLESDDLIAIAMRADAIRKQLHPGDLVTYTLSDETSAGGADGPILRLNFKSDGSPEDHLRVLEAAAQAHERSSPTAVCPVFTGSATGYLKLLAITRICLTTVLNVQTYWGGFGPKITQVALKFGANDITGAGDNQRPPEEEIRRLIRDAGFNPKQRTANFATYSIV